MNIPDLILENQVWYQFFGLKILEFLDADSDPGSCQPCFREVGSEILDKHPRSVILEYIN